MKRILVFPALVATIGLSAMPAMAERSTAETLLPAQTEAGAFLAAEAARTENDYGAAVKYYGDVLTYDPENPAIQQELLLALLTNGEFDAAVPVAEKLKTEADIERVSRVVLGIDAIRQRAWLQAESLLILTVESDLDRLVTGIMRGWARFGNGDAKGAIDLVDKLKGPDWYTLFQDIHTALIADAAGMNDVAAKRYEEAMNNTAGGSAAPQAYLRLAQAYAGFLARQGKTTEAQAIVDRALGLAPANPVLLRLKEDGDAIGKDALRIADASSGAGEILYDVATAINRDGAENFATLYFELALALTPNNNDIYIELAGISERLTKHERAIEFYDKIPADTPYGRLAMLQKGLNMADLGNNEEAEKELIAAVDEDPKELRGYLALGGLYASMKEFGKAAALYERAVANLDTNDSMFWPLYYRMGIAYERTKAWDKAEAAFKHALELSPNQPDVLNYLGYSWIDMNTNLKEGLEMIQKAVDMRPNDGYIVDSLGWAYYRLGRFDDAVDELEKATDLRPRDATINDHLGDAYWRVGRKLEATYQWSQVLGMEIEDDAAAKVRAKLTASNTPGEKPAIAESQVDLGPDGKTAASSETGNDG